MNSNGTGTNQTLGLVHQSTLDAVTFDVRILKENLDHLFLLVMGCVVFLMQAGFAFLEAGSVRSKNTTNILIKNVLDIFIGALSYWAIGYAFAFGGDGNGFCGTQNFFLIDLPASKYSYWFFQFVFAATAATIVSGSVAERTEFVAYLIYSVVLTGFVYPVATHWAWDSTGWLVSSFDDIVFQDFAGSGVVHIIGGTCALAGATALGPRIGRFDISGKPVLIQGHTVPMAALGGFILFFGFLAFNGGSQGAIASYKDAETVSTAILNTVLSGSGAAIAALTIKRLTGDAQHWSLLITINGALAGMVAICAGANVVYTYAAVVIGVIGAIQFNVWSWFLLKCHVDDPLDAVAVHMGSGFWGLIAVCLFNPDSGLLYQWDVMSLKLLGWNVLGGICLFLWSGVCCFLMFLLLKKVNLLRVPTEIEIKGLDIPKHGEPAYPPDSYGDGWIHSDPLPQLISQTPTKEAPAEALASMNGNAGISNEAFVAPIQNDTPL